jgi:pumilio RNA-binding family
LNEVFERVLDLTRDMYGNYVISHVLEHGKPADKLFVITKIKKKVLALSNHKFGSNVIEKCLVHSDKKQKEEIINEILLIRVSTSDE